MSSYNIYQDPHTGGWIREYRDSDGRWHRIGVYGTRAAAMRG
jgi:hypothetical protein